MGLRGRFTNKEYLPIKILELIAQRKFLALYDVLRLPLCQFGPRKKLSLRIVALE